MRDLKKQLGAIYIAIINQTKKIVLDMFNYYYIKICNTCKDYSLNFLHL